MSGGRGRHLPCPNWLLSPLIRTESRRIKRITSFIRPDRFEMAYYGTGLISSSMWHEIAVQGEVRCWFSVGKPF